MGVANISIVTVYDRRSEFRLYKLSGMSSSDYMKFSIGEGIVAGLSGGVLGFIAGYSVNMLVPGLGSIIQRFKGFNAMPFVVGVVWGANMPYSTPIGASVITMTMQGGYRFKDYTKINIVWNALAAVVVIICTTIFLPLGG